MRLPVARAGMVACPARIAAVMPVRERLDKARLARRLRLVLPVEALRPNRAWPGSSCPGSSRLSLSERRSESSSSLARSGLRLAGFRSFARSAFQKGVKTRKGFASLVAISQGSNSKAPLKLLSTARHRSGANSLFSDFCVAPDRERARSCGSTPRASAPRYSLARSASTNAGRRCPRRRIRPP